MKKFVIATFAFLIFTPQTFALSDVSGHAYQQQIESLKMQGIVGGYPDGTFRPDAGINRVEFLKILLEAHTPDIACTEVYVTYPDTDSNAWYDQYVQDAYNCGAIATGYPDGTFRPSNPVNAAEASKMIVQRFGLSIGIQTDIWYEQYVFVLQEYNAIPPTVSAFDKALTRGEMAYMIATVLEGKSQPSNALQDLGDGMNDVPPDTMQTGFVDYTEGVIGNGEESVLFFHAEWCPFCIKNAEKLNTIYDAEAVDIFTYKIDYDTAIELKSRYGVTGQDTFILIDGTGQEVDRVSFPSEEKLRELLGL